MSALLQTLRSKLSTTSDPVDLASLLYPLTPPGTVITMGQFRPDLLIDGFIQIVALQDGRFSRELWQKIISFFTSDQNSLRFRIGVQILYLMSKLDKLELSRLPGGSFSYVDVFRQDVPFVATLTVEPPEMHNYYAEMKSHLLKPAIFSALKATLREVGLVEGSDFDDEKIRNLISSMKIYPGRLGSPLRGCCLVDGVFINLLAVQGAGQQQQIDADVVTLLAHESVHFLIRSLKNDYTISSPFLSGDVKMDISDENGLKLMESGRCVEIKLFGKQPNWHIQDCATLGAAVLFFDSGLYSTELPLSVGSALATRPASISIGIDYPVRFALLE